ncbi:MAG: flagellar biosynthesis anti-sigma factor FlgM [Bdellovibrionaceae bacterium]|nr:flagellar biosynthesis anti-sigma factor FlgM [Bdellovibrionales bacterium]MCB9084879.1 flagellar biosynthesis anti-sigma factor FlgM [Pseudobdellovibrionaceae bacterium]
MKVTNNSAGTNVQNINSAKQKAVDGTDAKGGSGVDKAEPGSVKLNLSDRAQAFQKAKEIASKVDVDEAKVARLQKLIDEGKYSVDASAIADRLVDDHLGMPE